MTGVLRFVSAALAALSAVLLSPMLHASPPASEIGVVVMHGKGGQPGKNVNELAAAFERAGFQVANLEMPWAGRRQYDVALSGGIDEITRALDGMRAKGARRVFLAGHSQGGLFALYYAGLHRVDGVLAIAPGGQVDAGAFVTNLSSHVARARQMVGEGRGNDRSDFGDYEGSRGTNTITTTAAIYLDWFDPGGALTTRVFGRVKEGTPVLYVAPVRDHPGLAKSKRRNFGALPDHQKTRMYEPNSGHLNAPAASSEEAVAWIRQISER